MGDHDHECCVRDVSSRPSWAREVLSQAPTAPGTCRSQSASKAEQDSAFKLLLRAMN